MGAILPPKTPRYGGEGVVGGGGKYFLYLYPIYSLNSEFQVPNTKIGGSALKGGQFYPQNPSFWGVGEEGVNIF